MPTASMHFSGPLPPVISLQPLDHALVPEVDRDGAAGPRHGQALGHAVDGDDLLRTEQHGAADGHWPTGPAPQMATVS